MAFRSLEDLVYLTETNSWYLDCLCGKIVQAAASTQEIPGIRIDSFPELTLRGCVRNILSATLSQYYQAVRNTTDSDLHV